MCMMSQISLNDDVLRSFYTYLIISTLANSMSKIKLDMEKSFLYWRSVWVVVHFCLLAGKDFNFNFHRYNLKVNCQGISSCSE